MHTRYSYVNQVWINVPSATMQCHSSPTNYPDESTDECTLVDVMKNIKIL